MNGCSLNLLIDPFVITVDISSFGEHESFMRELSASAFYYLITQMFIKKFVMFLQFQFIMGQVVPSPRTLLICWNPNPQYLRAFKEVIKLKLGC